MSRRKSNNLILTQRDHKVFHFLFRGKVSHLAQINKYIFGGISRQKAGERLNRLVAENFLNKDAFLVSDLPKVNYQLTSLGLDKIRDTLPYSVSKNMIKSDSPIHDITLNHIRDILVGREKVKSLFSENELQSYLELKKQTDLKPFIELNSDVVLALVAESKNIYVALEYDATRKSLFRYKDKIKSYYRHTGVPAVLYMAKEKQILDVVKKAEAEVVNDIGKPFKFYYLEYLSVLNRDSPLIFANQSGRIFKL